MAEVDNSVIYGGAEDPPFFSSKVNPEDQKDYDKWSKDNVLDPNHYDLPAAYYDGMNHKAGIKDVDSQGMLLISPYHPEFHSKINDLEKQGRRPYVNPNGRIYMSDPININEDDEIKPVDKLPGIQDRPIKVDQDLLDNINKLGSNNDVNNESQDEVKKSSGHGQDIAYLLPLREAKGKYSASELGKGSKDPAVARGPYQFLPDTWNYLKELKLIPKNYSVYNIDHAKEGAGKYLNMLEDKFGSPELAIAAYNWGPNKVSKLIKIARGHGIEDPGYSDLKDSIPEVVNNYINEVSSFKKEDADVYHSKYKNK